MFAFTCTIRLMLCHLCDAVAAMTGHQTTHLITTLFVFFSLFQCRFAKGGVGY